MKMSLSWALALIAMALPALGFTTAATFLFLSDKVWQGVMMSIFALLTLPSVKLNSSGKME